MTTIKDEFLFVGSNVIRKDRILHVGMKKDNGEDTITFAFVDNYKNLDIIFFCPSIAALWLSDIQKELKK